MKKLLLLVAALALLFSSAWFSSCSKKSSDTIESSDTIVGTTWIYSGKTGNVSETYTLKFISESAFSMTTYYSLNGDSGSDTINGIYNVNGNSITLIISVQTTTGIISQTLTGTMNGNTMTLFNPEGDAITFTKI